MPLEGKLRPGEPWTFDSPVAQEFDSMLDRSVPGYTRMRSLVADLAEASYIRKPKTWIVDLGCARGTGLAELVKRIGAQGAYWGGDASEPMLDAARERYAGWIDAGIMEFANVDFRTFYPAVPASVTLCVLTLQFLPIEYRSYLLRRAWEATVPGGVFILVEKVLGESDALGRLINEQHLAEKRKAGYTEDEIVRKRLALEGVLVPVTAEWNVVGLRQAGWLNVECFWRDLNFAGWIAKR